MMHRPIRIQEPAHDSGRSHRHHLGHLDDAITNAREAGFTVIPGGTHADGATHNALIAFTDGAYIELIAPTNGIEGKDHRWFPRLASGGGLVDMCLFLR